MWFQRPRVTWSETYLSYDIQRRGEVIGSVWTGKEVLLVVMRDDDKIKSVPESLCRKERF